MHPFLTIPIHSGLRSVSKIILLFLLEACTANKPRPHARDLPLTTQSKDCVVAQSNGIDSVTLRIRISLAPQDSTERLDATLRILDRNRNTLQHFEHVTKTPFLTRELPQPVWVSLSQKNYLDEQVSVELTPGCLQEIYFVLTRVTSSNLYQSGPSPVMSSISEPKLALAMY